MAINDSYYIFSDEQLYTKTEAENKCKEVNGKLALVSNEVVTEEILNVIDYKMPNKTWIEDSKKVALAFSLIISGGVEKSIELSIVQL